MALTAAPLGPPPPAPTFYTLGAAALVAIIANISRTIRDNKGAMPRPGVLLSELGLGLVAGIMLPLWIGDIKPIGFGTAVVLGGIGGAFGYPVIKGIAGVLGGKWGIKIEGAQSSQQGGADDSTTETGGSTSDEQAEEPAESKAKG